MSFAETIKTAGTDFLFTFNHKLDIAWQLAGLDHKFESFGLHETLSFIVVGTTSPNLAILDDGFERGGAPLGDRLNGHHIHVAINEHGGFLGVDDFLAIDHWVSHGGHHLGLVAASLQQIFFPFFSTTHHVSLVIALGTDGGNANEVK